MFHKMTPKSFVFNFWGLPHVALFFMLISHLRLTYRLILI